MFSLALLPQIYNGWRSKTGHVSYFTSIPTGLGLFVIGYVYLNLQLLLSALICIIAGSLWMVLAIQRALYKKTPPVK